MPSFYKKWTGGGKRWLPCGGILASALYYVGSNFPVIPRQNCLPWMALRLGGRDTISAMTLLFSWCGQRMKWQGLIIMVCWPYGWTLARPGSYLWRKQWGNWLPMPPANPIGLTPWCSCMRTPAMHHSPGGACGHPTPTRDRGNSLWLSQPTRSLPTPHCQPPNHLSHRFEWAWWTHYNLLTRGISQQHWSFSRWTCLPRDWHSPPTMEEPNQKVTPLGKVSTIIIASPHMSTLPNWKERAAWPGRWGISCPKWY